MNNTLLLPPTVDDLIAYENGTMESPDVVRMFCRIINTRMHSVLQGSYGRSARALLKAQAIIIGRDGIAHPNHDHRLMQ